MWIAIFALTILAALAGILFFINKIKKFDFLAKISKGRQAVGTLISVAIIFGIMAILTILFSFTNMLVIVLHLLVFWILFDLIALIIRKLSGKSISHQMIATLSVVMTFAYLLYGWCNLRYVRQTDYLFDTDKDVGDGIRIVQITDTHIGTSFHWQGFAKHVEKINEVNPDVVVITGDFVDDSSTYEDMVKCCEALSNLKTRYGVYFVFGNHDKGYSPREQRGYGYEEIVSELTKNNVRVLEDENVLIDNRFYIIGRQDLSEGNRAQMDELVAGIDMDKYSVVLDHQPHEYDAQARSMVDLVLSGHTHGGQLIPVLYVGEWIGVNDRTYGHEKRNVTDFIVSSGVSDWEVKFKTGCVSEYVIIDVK